MRITKNKTYSKLVALVSVSLLIAFVLLVAISCSSHSVRDIRTSKGGKKSKKSKATTTATYEPRTLSKEELKKGMDEMQKLFSLRDVVNIDMPDMRGLELDSTGAVIVDPNIILSNWEQNRLAKLVEPVVIDPLQVKDTLLPDVVPTDTVALMETDIAAVDTLELAVDSLSPAVDALLSDTIAVTDDLDLTINENEEDIYASSATTTTQPTYTPIDEVPISLSELVAKSKGRYIPERNRKINTGFVIHVPKVLLSPLWRMTISPKFVMNDSVTALPNVVLKGQNFLEKQKQSYQDYEDFLASIVSRDEYDNKFLDYEGISADMKSRQDLYYSKYHENWQKQIDYEKWKNKWVDDQSFETALQVAERKELYHKAQRDARDEKFKLLAAGRDTSGVYAEHMKHFNKRSKKLPEEFETPVLTVIDVPKKYKTLFVENRKVEHIKNAVLTEQDSIQIAKHHYLVDEIALNELKDTTREHHRDLIIPFPYEKDSRLDTIVDGTSDFLYYYSHETRLPEGDYHFSLLPDSKIENFGMNAFNFPEKAPIEYQVTSLIDLINPNLYIKETTINRNMYFTATIYPKYESEKSDFKIGLQDNRSQIQQILDEYKKYVADNGFVLDSIRMATSTSLDGSWDFNVRLTVNRGDALKNYLLQKEFHQLTSNAITTFPRGEDWNTLGRLINSRNDMPNKEAIINMMMETIDPDETERTIRRTYKRDYKIMTDSLYPKLKKTEMGFFFHRPGMEVLDSIQENEIPGYQESIRLMRERKYWDAITALSEYPDYNTALCLVCMGDYKQAYSLLTFLAPDAEIYYLMAIAAYHLGNEEDAVEHLKSAIYIDPDKAKRVPMDPEMVLLVEKYNL